MPAKKSEKSKSATTKVVKPKINTAYKAKATDTKKTTRVTTTQKSAGSAAVGAKFAKPTRTDVFISYSHADKSWLSQLKIHLKPLTRDHKINIWEDTKLRGGDKWRDEIQKALDKAKVAILLVSASFMASDFIANNELPPLLKAAKKEGVLILPVIVGQSGAFAISNLSQFQAMNGPSQPLNQMTQGQVDEVFTQLFTQVYEAFVKPATQPKAKAKSDAVTAVSSEVAPTPVTNRTVKSSRSNVQAKTTPKQNKMLLVKKTGEWEVITVLQFSLKRDLTLTLKPSTSQQKAFLTSLRQSNQLSSVVLGEQTHLCSDLEIEQKGQDNQETWHLIMSIQSPSRRAQITFGNVTPDVQAEMQAQLLLLNKSIPIELAYYRRSGLTASFDASPFLNLFHQLSPALFKQVAPFIACWYLQMNSIVEDILQLTMTLKGKILTVNFKGQRSSQYANDKPMTIEVRGECDLSKPNNNEPLLLGPVNRF